MNLAPQPGSLKFDKERYALATAEESVLSLLKVPSDPVLTRRMMLNAIELCVSKRSVPAIGCVIARGEELVAVGRRVVTEHPTGPAQYLFTHAEQNALKASLTVPHELVLYTTLEPCASRGAGHGGVPCCTELILRSGIKTVVVGCIDADPRTRGEGIRRLVSGGITVERGDLGISEELINVLGDADFTPRPDMLESP